MPCVAFRSQCFHDEYLPSFNLPSVQLVDTDGVGVERITPKGFVAACQEFEVDCMIFATGFESGIGDVPGVRNMGYDLEGRGGVTLSEPPALEIRNPIEVKVINDSHVIFFSK